jgi:hypothetical protein
MLLAANVFNAVIHGLESDAGRGTRSARRDPRVLLSTRLNILPCPDGLENGMGALLSVPVRDLSRGGLRFLLPRRLPLDTQFIAALPGAGHLAVWNADSTSNGSSFPMPPPQWLQAGPGKSASASPVQLSDKPLMILSGVAYWQPLAKDLFAIGGQFLRILRDVAVPNVEPRVVLPGHTDADDPSIPAALRQVS